MTEYQRLIAKELARSGRVGMDPRHVEAFMRTIHRTLDGLSPEAFRDAALEASDSVVHVGPVVSEELAQSYGLRKEVS